MTRLTTLFLLVYLHLFSRVYTLAEDDGPVGSVPQLLQGHVAVHGAHPLRRHRLARRLLLQHHPLHQSPSNPAFIAQ